jgi:hypothetical protein
MYVHYDWVKVHPLLSHNRFPMHDALWVPGQIIRETGRTRIYGLNRVKKRLNHPLSSGSGHKLMNNCFQVSTIHPFGFSMPEIWKLGYCEWYNNDLFRFWVCLWHRRLPLSHACIKNDWHHLLSTITRLLAHVQKNNADLDDIL